jgi:adenylosuccinate synthase
MRRGWMELQVAEWGAVGWSYRWQNEARLDGVTGGRMRRGWMDTNLVCRCVQIWGCPTAKQAQTCVEF